MGFEGREEDPKQGPREELKAGFWPYLSGPTAVSIKGISKQQMPLLSNADKSAPFFPFSRVTTTSALPDALTGEQDYIEQLARENHLQGRAVVVHIEFQSLHENVQTHLIVPFLAF